MNTVTIGTTLAIALTCMIIGFATGGAIGYFNKDKRKKKFEDAPEQIPAPTVSAVSAAAPLADPAKFTELLRLWRAKEGSGLFVETSGHLLASSQPLNSNQKKRFIDLIKELAVWLELPSEETLLPQTMNTAALSEPISEPIGAVSAVEVKPAPEVKESLVKASESVKTNPIPSALTPPIPSAPIPSAEVQASAPPVVRNSIPQAPVRPPSEPAKKSAGSMVEQIDDILQEIVQFSDNPTRRIKLVEESHEGVIVWVGQEHFVGIDAVTDQSAKDLIRAAVKEWDRRTETHT